jgi:molybdenum cofactor synthesis domain-containing protein
MSGYTAAVITVSDKGYQGLRQDTSGPALCAMLAGAGYQVIHTAIVPDEGEQIAAALTYCADTLEAALILTTGGTGFSPRDVTPEATLSVAERLCPGIAEAMRAESLKITPRGCLSRGVAALRGRSLIVNLPGSEKAARENLAAVLDALGHGIEMLRSQGSADCAATAQVARPAPPSADDWLQQAKAEAAAAGIGMYLIHNGVVRATARAAVREGQEAPDVAGMWFDYDEEKAEAAAEKARQLPGIGLVRWWMNRGQLRVGDDIMYVLVGGDTRPHVLSALEALVGELKTHCVTEREQFLPQ